jgi:hypothetical protein
MIRAVLIAGLLFSSAGVLTTHDRAAMGVAVAYALLRSAPPAPPPAPAPVGKVCPECAPDGRPVYPDHPGQVGDGTIFTPCPNASCPYKPTEHVVPVVPGVVPDAKKPEQYAVPPKDGRVYRKRCVNGQCWWEPVP